jgi:hypothetical protein
MSASVMQPLGAPTAPRRPSLLQIPGGIPGVSFALDSPALLPMNMVRAAPRARGSKHRVLSLPGLATLTAADASPAV